MRLHNVVDALHGIVHGNRRDAPRILDDDGRFLSLGLPLVGLSMNVFGRLKEWTSATGSYVYSGSVLITGLFHDAGTVRPHRPFKVRLLLSIFGRVLIFERVLLANGSLDRRSASTQAQDQQPLAHEMHAPRH